MSMTLSRANTDLLNIDLIYRNTSLSPIERMELIARIVENYTRAVGNMPDAHGARKRMANRDHLGRPREWVGTRPCHDSECSVRGAHHHKVYA